MQNVCIIGGTSALGMGLIRHFNAKYYNVLATFHKTKPQIEEWEKLVWVGGDVCSEKSIKRIFDRCVFEYGQIDILINCQGVYSNAMAKKMSQAQWNNVLSANLTSVFNSCRHAPMRECGNIVNISSIVGLRGSIGCANYVASKAGIIGMSKALALEFVEQEVNINVLALGFCEFGMGQQFSPKVKNKILAQIPMGRFAMLDEVVEAVDFLAHTTYMTGNVLELAGGM